MSLYLWTLTQVVRCVKCFSLERGTSCAFFVPLKNKEDLAQRVQNLQPIILSNLNFYKNIVCNILN